MKINTYDKLGKNIGTQDMIDVKTVDSEDVIGQYLKVYFSNQSQGTSKVKTRSEVRGGGAKPWNQKGTGRARAGTNRSPLWVGGGVIHGPTPRTRTYRLNSKLKKKSFEAAIAIKQQENTISMFEKWGETFSTKLAQSIVNVVAKEDKVLVLHSGSEYVYKSFRNIPSVTVCDVNNVNAYDVISSKNILVEKDALKVLELKVK